MPYERGESTIVFRKENTHEIMAVMVVAFISRTLPPFSERKQPSRVKGAQTKAKDEYAKPVPTYYSYRELLGPDSLNLLISRFCNAAAPALIILAITVSSTPPNPTTPPSMSGCPVSASSTLADR